MAFTALSYDPKDIRDITLAASVCDHDRRIIEAYEIERPEFREFDRAMRSNVGVRL